eukprot:9450374-Alexandrium_andersonii.AAC.1
MMLEAGASARALEDWIRERDVSRGALRAWMAFVDGRDSGWRCAAISWCQGPAGLAPGLRGVRAAGVVAGAGRLEAEARHRGAHRMPLWRRVAPRYRRRKPSGQNRPSGSGCPGRSVRSIARGRAALGDRLRPRGARSRCGASNGRG